MMSEQDGVLRKRAAIADAIIAHIDTVTLCTCKEVEDIRERAMNGEFDGLFQL
jgi:hypothetical protein